MGSVAETKLCGGQSHKVNDVIKSVRDIEIRARRLSDGLVTGAYLSRFKGSGLDFTEIRRYEPGDDIRAIDWNVTARMGYPYIKEFIEERDIAVYLVVDISGSADFGTQKALKSDMAIELCASVAYSAMKNNDRVGMLLFSDKVEKFVKLGKGRKHMMRIIHEIVKFNPESRMTDLREPLRFLSRVIKQKSIIFIVSDFIDDVNNYSKELGLLARDHDVIAIDLYDAREMSIPDIGYIELEDGETG
ncbi:MAG: DUF58 domain-containing protein, partial [archaeon]|nr:DUF58 domain-containing protein [archaeon]